MTHVTVATDNITLRGQDVEPEALLIFATAANDYLERNREAFAQAYADLMIFGSCVWPSVAT